MSGNDFEHPPLVSEDKTVDSQKQSIVDKTSMQRLEQALAEGNARAAELAVLRHLRNIEKDVLKSVVAA